MKQAEKNQKSRTYILTHAFAEFAAHGYAGSSLNEICAAGGISKGLLYHYYKNKDMLYLACVERLFADLTAHLRTQINADSITPADYFAARLRFFRANPQHQRLFYDVNAYPPPHLSEGLQQARADFDQLSDELVRAVLAGQILAPGLDLADAMRQFRAFVDFFGVYLREGAPDETERQAEALLHTLLYGLIAR